MNQLAYFLKSIDIDPKKPRNDAEAALVAITAQFGQDESQSTLDEIALNVVGLLRWIEEDFQHERVKALLWCSYYLSYMVRKSPEPESSTNAKAETTPAPKAINAPYKEVLQ